ncbi:MAG: hypothetical protein KAR18_06275 [Spirochaetes bacterium]|nr:hypothetical protein [Spirochaetota bacterium]
MMNLGPFRPNYRIDVFSFRMMKGKAYLTTQTASYRAIKIYLDFGFTPFLDNETSLRAWRALAGYLHHPLLAEFE